MAQIAALVIEVSSNTVTKKQNQTLNVRVNCTYVGPAQQVLFYAVVTQDTWYSNFDEIGSTKKAVYVDLSEALTPVSFYFDITGLPLSGVEPKTSAYGVKVKAEGTFGTVEAGNKACLYVQSVAEVIAFDLTKPTASPSQAKPGDTVRIFFQVTSKCTKQQIITIKVLIYEGSIYTGHGTLLTTKTADFIISPGTSATVDSFYDTAVAGTIDRRDVGIEIYVGAQLIKESEWDDVYYVTTGVAATLSASYSGGVCSYSFSGFQPNATVTLTVVQTGGYLTAIANASGSGSGSFYDNDPAGTYTLKATDSYGHSATATFTK